MEELIPSAKQLKDIGIREKTDKERVDLRTAAWKLAQDLRSYQELGALEKAIQQATHQLAILNMVNEQQKQAITENGYGRR